MLRLIKMDFYRLFNSKALKVGAIMAALASALYIFFSLGVVSLADMAFSTDPSMAEGMGFLLAQVAWITGVNFAEIVFSGTAWLALFIGCMVTASFIGSEHSCGYTKNYAGQLKNKGYMAVSKLVVTSFVQLVILVIYAIVCSGLARVTLGKYINGYDIKGLLCALALRLLLHFAINAIIIFICTLTKSHSLAMVVGCIFGLGVTKFAYTTIAMLLGAAKINIDIESYMPDGINGQLAIETVGELSHKAIMVSIIFIIAFLAANYYVVRNRDVK